METKKKNKSINPRLRKNFSEQIKGGGVLWGGGGGMECVVNQYPSQIGRNEAELGV